MASGIKRWQDVIAFWFEETTPMQHYKKDPAFDNEIRQRFLSTHTAASKGELFTWRDTSMGRVAEIVVLDQFSRNLFRDSPKAFENDVTALILSQEAIRLNIHKELQGTPYLGNLLLPYMHSESLAMHELALKFYAVPGMESSLKYEQEHHKLIAQFGRYPHRNAVLGRESTAEEKKYLKVNPNPF